MTVSNLFANGYLALVGTVVATLYVASMILLGTHILRWLNIGQGGRTPELAAATGAVAFSLLFTCLAICQCAYGWMIGALGVAPLVIWRDHLRQAIASTWMELKHSTLLSWNPVLATLLGAYLLYGFVHCSLTVTGPDLGIYHLAVLRDTLHQHGFKYNHFFFGAGLQYGWHMLGLPAYLLGGERGYTCLSFWAFVGVLKLVYGVISRHSNQDNSTGSELATLSVALVICGIAGNTISGNDLAWVFIEFVLLQLVFSIDRKSSLSYAVVFGLLSGFMLAIKLTTLAGAAIIAVIYCWRTRFRFDLLCAGGGIAFLMGSIWPTITFYHSGSFLPQFMMQARWRGAPPAHMLDTVPQMTYWYGVWYQINVGRCFSGPMSGLSVLLTGLAAAIIGLATAQRDVLLRFLVPYAVGRWALLSVLSGGRLDAIYHDRYHMISVAFLAAAGSHAWMMILQKYMSFKYVSPTSLATIAATMFVTINWLAGYESYYPDPSRKPPIRISIVPKVSEVATIAADMMAPQSRSTGPMFHWINNALPANAVVAGTAINPYFAGRKYLQLLPVSQGEIDLSLEPNAILGELQKAGATHLHLQRASGLPPFMIEICWKWLNSVGRIPRLPGVQLLHSIDSNGVLLEALYELPDRDETSRDDVRWVSDKSESFFPTVVR